MRRRIGLMSIGLAIVMLLFSLIATIILTNVGRNLIKAAVDMGKGQEEAYTRIVIQSVKNGLSKFSDDFGDLKLEALDESNFLFEISKDLNTIGDGELSINFVTTAKLIAKLENEDEENNNYIFEIETKADGSIRDLEEGVILYLNGKGED
jgi:hypothetical protein